jgi:hypothetical protein
MKNIKDFILEAKDYWTCKFISKNDILKFGVEALKKGKLTASDILDEIGQYEDPDDLDRAWENKDIDKYCHFENMLGDLLFEDDKYTGKEGDICDAVWGNAWDYFTELEKMTSK